MLEESCGFNKWSLGIDLENGCIVVRFNHFPNIGEVRLHDIVGDDLERLASMFREAADGVEEAPSIPGPKVSEDFLRGCGWTQRKIDEALGRS